MKALLENVDLYAHKINFNYNHRNLYHSFFGMGLSFCLYGVMIYFIHYFSKDLFKKENPKIFYQETEFEYYKEISLTDLFNFSDLDLTLYLSSKNFISNTTKGSKNVNITSENLGELSIIHFSRKMNFTHIFRIEYQAFISYLWKSKGKEKSPSQPFCYIYEIKFKLNNNPNLWLLKTQYDESIYSSEDFHHKAEQIFMNNSQLTLNPLDSIEIVFKYGEYIEYLENSEEAVKNELLFFFKTKNKIINANDESFFKSFDKEEYAYVRYNHVANIANSKITRSNYGIVELSNDRGFILSDKENKTAIKKNYDILETFDHNDDFNRGIILYEMKIDNLLKHYDRIYKKVQNVFADVGGLLNSFILIGNILIIQFNKKKIDYDIINKLFKDENDEIKFSKNDKDLQFKLPVELLKNLNILEKVSSRFPRDYNRTSNLKQKEEINHITIKLTNKDKSLRIIKDKSDQNSSARLNKLSNLSLDRLNADYGENENSKPIEKLFINQEIKANPNVNVNDIKKFVSNYNNEKLFKKPLKFSKLDLLRTFLCCKKLKNNDLIEKEKVFAQAQFQIYEYLDVINYLLLFEKFDKLISIILNDHQVISFNLMSDRKIKEIKSNALSEESVRKVVDYYKEFLQKPHTSSIDSRLLKGLCSSFSKLIIDDQ